MTDQEAIKLLKDASRNNEMLGIMPKSDIGSASLRRWKKYSSTGQSAHQKNAERRWRNRKLIKN